MRPSHGGACTGRAAVPPARLGLAPGVGAVKSLGRLWVPATPAPERVQAPPEIRHAPHSPRRPLRAARPGRRRPGRQRGGGAAVLLQRAHGAAARPADPGVGPGGARREGHRQAGDAGRGDRDDGGRWHVEGQAARQRRRRTLHPGGQGRQRTAHRGRAGRRGVAVLRPIEHGVHRRRRERRREGEGRGHRRRDPPALRAARPGSAAHGEDGRALDGLLARDRRRLHRVRLLHGPPAAQGAGRAHRPDQHRVGRHAHRAVDARGRLRRTAGAEGHRRPGARHRPEDARLPAGHGGAPRQGRGLDQGGARRAGRGWRRARAPGAARRARAADGAQGPAAAADHAVQRHDPRPGRLRPARRDLVPGRVEPLRGRALHREDEGADLRLARGLGHRRLPLQFRSDRALRVRWRGPQHHAALLARADRRAGHPQHRHGRHHRHRQRQRHPPQEQAGGRPPPGPAGARPHLREGGGGQLRAGVRVARRREGDLAGGLRPRRGPGHARRQGAGLVRDSAAKTAISCPPPR